MPRAKRFWLWEFLSWCRSVLVLDPLIYVYTMVLGTLSLLSSLFDRSGRVQHWFARTWSWLILKTCMCPVYVVDGNKIDTSRPHVYAANHLSALDIPVLYVHLPNQFRIIAKKELFRYPFLGWHLRRSGQLAIDQSNPTSAIRSLRKAVETLREGMPLVIFPEGGRSGTGQIQPFLSGAFYLAIKAQVDVVPLAIVGTYEILPMNHFHVRPGRIELLVGQPISTAGMRLHDIDALAARVQRAIEDMYYAQARVADPRKAAATGAN
ncbi:MAG: lysophospholipid acyltransferase family protein [Terriglobales bacterium]